MDPEIIKPAAGKILVSEPSMQDFYFRKSVVLLADHNSEGSFGLIINKPIDVRLNDILKDFPSFDVQLYLGGPVKTNSLFYIHTLGEAIPNSMKILRGLYWGGDLDTVKSLIFESKLNADQIRFFVGYSGWAARQLDRELKEKSWVVSKTGVDTLIHSNPANLWNSLIRSLGKDYAIWANFPLDPAWN